MRPESEIAVIRRSPNEADLNRLTAAAQEAVGEIVKLDGALGPEGVSKLYIERIYAATIAGDMSKRHDNKYRKALTDLTVFVIQFLDKLDEVMRQPSSPERGARVAKLSNALEMANDRIRYSILGVDYRTDDKGRKGKKRR